MLLRMTPDLIFSSIKKIVSGQLKWIEFYRAFNVLWTKIGGKAFVTVILRMAKCFCLPILLNGFIGYSFIEDLV